MTDPIALDDVDHQILRLLKENARRPLRSIAEQVGLTVAPVQRRIARLEDAGVIERYTVQVDQSRVASGIEAVVELRYQAGLELPALLELIGDIPEVGEVLTLAGDPDAMVRITVSGVHELGRIVRQLRASGRVASTKTMVVLDRWSQAI